MSEAEPRTETTLLNPQEKLTFDEDYSPLEVVGSFGASLMVQDIWMKLAFDAGESPHETRRKEAANQLRDRLKSFKSNNASYDMLVRTISNYPLPPQLSERIYTEKTTSLDPIQSLGVADDETLVEFCHWNSQYQEVVKKERQPLIETYRKEWTERVHHAIDDQNLPVSAEQLNARMKQVHITLGDALVLYDKDVGGYYQASDRLIVVGAGYDEYAFKKILWHELMHHLSGQTVAQEKITVGEGGEKYSFMSFDIRRSGLHTNNKYQSRRWLNEALTEQLTQFLLLPNGENIDFETVDPYEFFPQALKKTGTYRKERGRALSFLDTLPEGFDYWTPEEQDVYSSPISPQILLAAYFEDHIPENTKGSRAEARRTLWAKILEAYPDNYREELQEPSKSKFPWLFP